MNMHMKPKITNTELPNHQCAIWTNCIIAVMWMRSLPNQKAAHLLVLGTQGCFFWKQRVQGKDGMKGKPTYI